MRVYTPYSQRDSRWGSNKLGTSNVTISDDGCFISSFCITASYYGHIVTPDQLNQIFINQNLYVSGDYVSSDSDLQTVYPDIVYQRTDHYESVPADLHKLQSYMSDESISVILEIDLGGGNTHFVVCQSCDGNTVEIVNPWDGLVENFTQGYGDPSKNILKFVVYKGNPQQATTQPNGLPPNYADIIQKSSNWDAIVQMGYHSPDDVKKALEGDKQAIHDISDARDSQKQLYETELETNKTLLDQLTQKQEEVKTLEAKNAGLTTQISQVKKDNGDYLGKLQAYEKQDSTAIDEGIKAQVALKDANYTISQAAQMLKTQPNRIAILGAIQSLETQRKVQVNNLQTYFQAILNVLLKKKVK